VPVKNGNGEVCGLVFSLLNVTERERLMRQLDAEQSRLNAIIDNSPEGIVVTDENARVTLANPAAEQLYARPVPYGEPYETHAELCMCQPDGTAIPPRELPLTRSALDGETHRNEELAIVWPGGERRELLIDTVPIRGSDGQVTGAVGLFRDITQRKQTERAVWDYAQRLRALHELDQAILAADSPDEIAEAALARLRQLVTCRRASVEVFDFAADEAHLLAVEAEDRTGLRTGRRVPLTWHYSLNTLREGEAHVVKDLDSTPASPVIKTLQEEGVRSFISVPLRARGELIGALNVGLSTRGGPTAEEREVVEALGDQLAIGVRQARLHQAVQAHARELETRVKVRTAQLRASEARFRAIFEQSASGIALLDKKARVMASNEALHEMLERTAEELQGHRFTDFAHPDEQIEDDVDIYREIRDGARESYRMQTRYVTKSGEIGWANMVLSLVRDSQGTPQFVIAIVEDITERKRALDALRTSEQRQSVALQAVGGGIYEHPVPLDDTAYHSEGWARILGYERDELPPYDVFMDWLFDQVHPEDRNHLREAYTDFIEGRSERYYVEIRIRHKRGHWVWVEGLAEAADRDEDGRVTRVVGVMRDISEQKQAHQALIQSEKLATTGRLAASLAHEINNPLQTVVGCLGLAEESMRTDGGEVGEYVSMAHEELKRAARIVSRLRDLSRPGDAGRGRPTDINVLIHSVLTVSQKDLQNTDIRVVRDLEEDLPEPVVLEDRVKQVILNLVLNARDAMPRGGELYVATTYDEGNDEVVITVADQGAGIPQEMRNRLFDPFFSTKSDGSGLGLFVSQNIVREHGGRIEVKSKIGEGATFRVHLPVSQE
jgi:two-component system sporulation sensor kinase A